MPEQLSETEQWLPLSKAAECLNVHPTTLRRWADNGDIPVMLTPGGHRRFSTVELERFAQERHGLRTVNGIEEIWADQALTQTRQEIVVQRQDQSWLSEFDDEARTRHRLLGKQLMGLTMQYLSDENSSENILDEARKIGREYAQISLDRGLPLTQALQAALFFRDTMVETALHLPETVRIRPDANVRLLRRVNTLLNAVHLAIADVYDTENRDSVSGT